ncbi:unnamed protein product [Brachionus calyciflorus]|uniref:Uncharacterized protein n=1 Tax=Brachionus calyciflorus TaxID=104777 RepID=A0A814DN63_9BILA|nr:unnamed protein product [Brachionus calyciflorus]
MPSIDLAIYCERWNIIGSFFSDVIEINGADVEIYLNGWNGSDGSFDISNILQYIEQNKKEIEEKRKELKYLINFQNLLQSESEFLLRDLVQIYKSESFYEKFERLKNEKTDQEKEDLFKKFQDFFRIKISCFSYFNEHKDEIKRKLENIIKKYQLLDKNKDAEDKESFVESCTKINTELENFSNKFINKFQIFDQQFNTKKYIEIDGTSFEISANDLEDIDKAIINLEKQIHAQEIKIIDQNKLEEHLKDYNNLTLKIKDLEKDIYEQLEKIDNDSNNEDNLNKDLFKNILSLKSEIEQVIAKHYIELDSEKDSKSIEKISKVFVDFKEIIKNVEKTIKELEKLQKSKSNSDSNLENETKCFKIVEMDYLFKQINSQVDYISQKFKFFKEESFQIIFHSDDSISQSTFIQELELKDILKNLSELHSTLKTKCDQIKNAEKKLKNFLNKINYDSLKNYELKRNKCVEFILKSLYFKYYSFFYSCYELKGSDGENGGNSGVYKIKNNKFLVCNVEGKGGRNGPSLKGIYTYNYFATAFMGLFAISIFPYFKFVKKGFMEKTFMDNIEEKILEIGYFSKGPYLIESTITAKDGTVANEKRFMMHLKEIEYQIENPFNCKNLNDFLIQI